MTANTVPRSKFRTRIYYWGIGLVALGLLLLLASALPVVENLDNLPAVRGDYQSIALRGFSGSVLILIGFVAVTIGSVETTGSGVNVRPRHLLGESDESPVNEDERTSLPPVQAQSSDHWLDSPRPSWLDQGLCCLDCRSTNPSTARYCNQCGTEVPFRRRHAGSSSQATAVLGSA